jgi:hypothetical protein
VPRSGIDGQHRQLPRIGARRQGEETACRNNDSLPPGEAGKRREDAVADLDVLHPRSHCEDATDTFAAYYGWKCGADSIDAPCEQEVARVDRRKLNPDKDLIRAGSLGLGNVDVLKTFDGFSISRELNSTHIDISLVRGLLTTTFTESPFLVAMLDTL